MPKKQSIIAYCENKSCGVGLTSLHATGLCKACRVKVCAKEGCEKTFVITRGGNNLLCKAHQEQVRARRVRAQRI